MIAWLVYLTCVWFFILFYLLLLLLLFFICIHLPIHFLENCMRIEILVFPNRYLYIYLFSLFIYISFWENCVRLIPFFFKTQWSMYTSIRNLMRRIPSVDNHLTMIGASRVFYRIPITIHGSIWGALSVTLSPNVPKSTITCP